MRVINVMILSVILTVSGVRAVAEESVQLAQNIVKSSGISAGLCVHLGCTDGKLTTALAGQGKFVVHGLTPTQEETEKARQYIASHNLHGKVSVEYGSLSRLPYMDNLVNLAVVDDLIDALAKGLSMKEVMRVVCPNGVVYMGDKTGTLKADDLKSIVEKAEVKDFEIIRQSGIWAKIRKPRPKEMDEWTHWLHGPECNNHSSDSMAGPAARLQWVNGPVWHTGGNVTELFANGRSFNLIRQGGYKPQWMLLIARDAFNGMELWKRRIETTNPRLVVATGDRVFTVVEKNGPLIALDAATGEIGKTYDVGISPKSVLYVDGCLILGVPEKVCSIDAGTGKMKWQKAAADKTPFLFEAQNPMKYGVYKKPYIVSGSGRLFFFIKDALKPPYSVVCCDLETGTEKWREKQIGELVSYYRKVVFFYDLESPPTKEGHGKGTYYALSADDGHKLWDRPHTRRSNHPDDPCYASGLAWISDNPVKNRVLLGLDPLTGEEKKRITRYCPWGHCGRMITTDRYIIGKMTQFLSLDTHKSFNPGFYKNGCGVGQLPANGLTYTFPISCSCIAYIRGFAAFAPGPAYDPDKAAAGKPAPLEKGPAYGLKPKTEEAATALAWPTFRHDNRRSGCTGEALDSNLRLLWSKTMAGQERTPHGRRVTPPVVAEGLVLAASPDAQQITALDAGTGELRWRYLAGGRVETPPTIYSGLCLFGANNGWVTCLRARDGELVWRFRAAPLEQRIMAYGRLESPWPVPGVLVENGVAFFAAGRHSKIKDGILVYAADPFTGEVFWRTRVDNKRSKTWYDNHVNDLLVSDKEKIFMCQLMFDRKTGEKSRTWFKKKPVYTYHYLRSGKGRDTSAVFPAGFLYDRKYGVGLEREYATYWDYRGARGLVLAFTQDKVFGIEYNRKMRPNLELSARRFDDATRRSYEKMSKDAYLWSVKVPAGTYSLMPTGKALFTAGPSDKGGVLCSFSTDDGKKLGELQFDDAPIFDSMAAANGRLYISTQKGKVFCFEGGK